MNIEHNPISSPAHYTAYGVQPIAITRHLGFCLGNVVKYVLRAPYKGNPVQDLQKALQYLEWEKEKPDCFLQGSMNRFIITVQETVRDLQTELASRDAENDMAFMMLSKTKFFIMDLYEYLFVNCTPEVLDNMVDSITSMLKLYELEEKDGALPNEVSLLRDVADAADKAAELLCGMYGEEDSPEGLDELIGALHAAGYGQR